MSSSAVVEHGIDSAKFAGFEANPFIASHNIVEFPLKAPQPEVLPLEMGSGVLMRRAHWSKKRFKSIEDATFVARDQLLGFGASRDHVNTLFNKKGEFRYKDTSGKDVFDMDPDAAFAHVLKVYEPIFDAIGYYLDEPTKETRPYNDHGKKHHENTYLGAMDLLVKAGHLGKPDRSRKNFLYPQDLSPQQISLRTALAVVTHDGGYLVDPDRHPEPSIQLAEIVVPQLKLHPEEWKGSSRAVLLHEGDNFRKELKDNGVTTHADAIKFLAKEYPYVAAIIIADKIDQNRGRVRGGELLDQKAIFVDPRSYLADAHIETNLLTQINEVKWEKGSEDPRTKRSVLTFKVITEFDQSVEGDEEKDRLKYFLTDRSSLPGEQKINTSDKTKADYRSDENRMYYLDSLIERNLEVGVFRYMNVLIASFALKPDQEKAELIFRDVETGREVMHPFYRDTIDEDIEKFWSAYVPAETKQERGPEDLKI